MYLLQNKWLNLFNLNVLLYVFCLLEDEVGGEVVKFPAVENVETAPDIRASHQYWNNIQNICWIGAISTKHMLIWTKGYRD